MNFPRNIRIAVIRRFNSSARGPCYFIQWPMCNIVDRTQYGMEAGGYTEIRVW
jgi:hypothetical protein